MYRVLSNCLQTPFTGIYNPAVSKLEVLFSSVKVPFAPSPSDD
jgi:hypothetical protein